MKISVNERPDIAETEVTVNCRTADGEVLRLIASLRAYDRKLTGLRDNQTFLLRPGDVFYIDTVDKRTFLYLERAVYETPLRLYELEERLQGEDFFRAGKSSIVNLGRVASLQPELGGRMILTMENGEKLYVSRQYAAAIKARLGI